MRYFLLVFVLVAWYSYAQESLNYQLFDKTNSTLGTNVTYNVHQAPDGIVYVSGNSGLHRFDGKNFENYSKVGKGIAISSVQHDLSNRVWANTFQGDIYYLENDSLILHPVSTKLDGVSKFYRLTNGFYLTTYQQIFKLNEKTFQFELQETNGKIVIGAFSYAGKDYCVFMEQDGYYDLDNEHFVQMNRPLNYTSDCVFGQDEEESFVYYKFENLLLQTSHFIDTTTIDTLTLPYKGKVNCFSRINKYYFIGGMNGVRVYTRDGEFVHDFLPKVQVTHIICDNEGNLLVTSASHGLFIITNYDARKFDYSGVLDEEVIICSTTNQNSTLFLGTNAGLVIRHNLESNHLDTLRISDRSEVAALHFDSTENLLYVYSDKLFIVDPIQFTVKQILECTSVKQIASNEKSVFLGTRVSFEAIKKGGPVKKISRFGQLGWTYSISNYLQDNYIVSTKEGCYFVDDQLSVQELVLSPFKDTLNIHSITASKPGEIYFLNNNQQVYRIDSLNGKQQLFYAVNERSIYKIEAIPEGLLSYEKDGLKLLSYSDGRIKHQLSELNGLAEKRVLNVYRINGGYYCIQPTSFSRMNNFPKPYESKPKLHVLRIGGSFKYVEDKLVSDFEDNVLTLRIHVSQVLGVKGEYEVFYRIKGEQKKWSRLVVNEKDYQLERLPQGNQIIELMVMNKYGQPSTVKEIQLRIIPPFYFSTWFLVVSSIGLIGVVILLIRYYVGNANKKAQEKLHKQALEMKAYNAELKAIRSQMNPHFIFNVLTAIQSKVIEGDIDAAYDNIGDFAKLIRNVLDKSGKEYIGLKEELELITNYVRLENTRFTPPIQLRVNILDSAYFEGVQIPTLITQPFVENAIKHAFTIDQQEKKIEIKVEKTTYGFSIEIADNGVGIQASQLNKNVPKTHKSFALKAMHKRVENLDKVAKYKVDFDIHSDNQGTVVKLCFSWKKN